MIYDGAFSEHLTSEEKKGLTGEDIEEEQAKQKAEEFIGKNNIKEITNMGYSENATIPVYDFSVKNNNEETIVINDFTPEEKEMVMRMVHYIEEVHQLKCKKNSPPVK